MFMFENRTSESTYDRNVMEMYDHGNFDTTLVTSKDQPVRVHRFVLAMFSEYFLENLANVDYSDDIRGLCLIQSDFFFQVPKSSN